MTTALRLLLSTLFALALLPIQSAHAVDPELVTRLGMGDVAAKVQAIEALTRSADPSGLTLLRAAQEGNLAVTSAGQVIIVEGDAARDAATLRPIEPAPGEYESVTLNNRVCGQLESALSAFQLFSEDRAQRLAAAKALESSAQPSVLPILDKVLAGETDPTIKSVLAQVKAGVDLQNADPQVRLAAVRVLGESNAQRTKTLLYALLEKNASGQYFETDEQV